MCVCVCVGVCVCVCVYLLIFLSLYTGGIRSGAVMRVGERNATYNKLLQGLGIVTTHLFCAPNSLIPDILYL
jgi:hypothetical protein